MHFTSHIGQDQWVVEVYKYKRSGYFLDFGAFDGLLTSNTFYLEKYLGWTGVCVEPNPLFYAGVCAVRNCICMNVALWVESRQSIEFLDAHGLSSLASHRDADNNAGLREAATRRLINVDTINPMELLKRFSAPGFIEYMSLDVEGVEFDVLKEIDLQEYNIGMMTIEHNHQDDKRSAIREYLDGFGYEVIGHHNDDFFYSKSILDAITNGDYRDPVEAYLKVEAEFKIYDR